MSDEYKSLSELPEFEANINGHIRWTFNKKDCKIYSSSIHGSDKQYYYVKSQRWWISPDGKQDVSISCLNLIARLYVPNPDGYKFVKTIDGDVSNYKADNMMWVKSRSGKEATKTKQEYLQEYNAKYWDLNKSKLSSTHDCQCGGKYTNKHKVEHERSKRHIQYIELLETQKET